MCKSQRACFACVQEAEATRQKIERLMAVLAEVEAGVSRKSRAACKDAKRILALVHSLQRHMGHGYHAIPTETAHRLLTEMASAADGLLHNMKGYRKLKRGNRKGLKGRRKKAGGGVACGDSDSDSDSDAFLGTGVNVNDDASSTGTGSGAGMGIGSDTVERNEAVTFASKISAVCAALEGEVGRLQVGTSNESRKCN